MKKYTNIDEVVNDAENSLLESLRIGKEMIDNIPDKNIWRDLAVVTNEAFGQIFNTILKFIYPNDDDWKKKRFEEKVEMIRELKILNDIYARDLVILNNIRVHLAHGMKIDENKIKGFIHDTHTYSYNKEKMTNMSLQEKYHIIALRAIYILKHHQGQFVASYLNHLDGWEGSYYKFD